MQRPARKDLRADRGQVAVAVACDERQNVRALGRDRGPELLYDLYCQGTLDISEYPSVVAHTWSWVEFPGRHFDMPETWRDLFRGSRLHP